MNLLDNPVWSALTTVHANFSLGTDHAKRYNPDVAPFVAFKYAQQLVAHLCRQHVAAGIVSYLHVDVINDRAIRLYEHMGFEKRRPISFWQIISNA
jgi:hypothetical protein